MDKSKKDSNLVPDNQEAVMVKETNLFKGSLDSHEERGKSKKLSPQELAEKKQARQARLLEKEKAALAKEEADALAEKKTEPIKKIEKLTPEQEAAMPRYVEKWVAIGLSTKQQAEEDAIIDFSRFEKHILKQAKPAPVKIFKSPRHCWIGVEILKSNENYDISRLYDDVERVINGDKLTVNRERIEFVWPYFDGQYWASYFAYFDFFEQECGVKYDDNYRIMKEGVKYGMAFPIDECCIVCQPFSKIDRNANGLHCENGPALSYNGFCEVFALNGVRMNKEHVMSRPQDIDPKTVLGEQNVEVRRELIRKVGMELLLDKMPHKVLDTMKHAAGGEYTLYSVDLSEDVKNEKYLKMLNPSIGVWHLEAVEPSVKNCQEALNFRAREVRKDGQDWNPEVVT